MSDDYRLIAIHDHGVPARQAVEKVLMVIDTGRMLLDSELPFAETTTFVQSRIVVAAAASDAVTDDGPCWTFVVSMVPPEHVIDEEH